ncbi:MAG: alpha/beta fold hydrolase [Cyclobacteriaceae bacterium]|nr:alpha/beta fold hydrolase [Cyclobacteriaceae bacterium]
MVGHSIFIKTLVVLFFVFFSWSCDKEVDPITYCDCSTWENWDNEKDVKCGFLTVPEDHSKPMGKSIKIAFAIFKSKNKNADAIPVIYLAGGLGGRSLSSPDHWKNHESRQVGDLIVVEQRGTGLSSPLPDISETFIDIIAADASSEEEKEITLKAMKDKVAEIKAMGINLSKYNSTQNAKDFGTLMNALPYEKYNLYGAYYGTKLGIMTMKYFSSKINAAVLDQPTILNNTALEARFPHLVRAFNKLYEECANDSTCRAIHPNLKAETIEAIQSLKDKPFTVRLLDRDFTLNPQDAVFFIRYLFFKADAFETVPRFVHALNVRDTAVVEELGDFPARMLKGANNSTFLSFTAYEEFSESTPANVQAFMESNPELAEGVAWFQAFIPALVQWHDGRVSQEENTLKNIPVPTLIITNDLDPLMPPQNTKLFEDALLHNQVLRLNHFEEEYADNCISKIKANFLLHCDRKINTECLGESVK